MSRKTSMFRCSLGLAGLAFALALPAVAQRKDVQLAQIKTAQPAPPPVQKTQALPAQKAPAQRDAADESRGGWRTACKTDVRQLCRAASGGSAKRKCLELNTGKVSVACKTSLVERKVMRKETRRVCRPDLAKLCPDASGGKLELACLRQKAAQVTPPCTEALSKLAGNS